MPNGRGGHRPYEYRQEEDHVGSEHAQRPTVETEPPPGVLKKAIAASAIGNATEWFDYGISMPRRWTR